MAPRILLAFVAGIALGSFGVVAPFVFRALSVFAGALAVLTVLDRKRFYFFLLVIFFLAGVVRADFGTIELSFLEPVRMRLEAVADIFAERLSHALPEPYASYAAGIWLGDRSGIPLDLRDAFYKTGTSHIMALSGYNVTIIIDSLGKVLGGFWLPTLGIIFFVLATGAAPSLVRASLMGVLVLLTRTYSHDYSAGHALLAAIALMLFFDPALLWGDVGFQLSVAATAGLIWFAPKWHSKLKKIPKAFGFRDAAISTVAAQLATLPLIFWYFGGVSWVSLPANILVQVAMPYSMFFSFIAGLTKVIWWPAFLFLAYQIFIVRLFAGL